MYFRFVLMSTLAVYHGTSGEADYSDLEYINVSPVRHMFGSSFRNIFRTESQQAGSVRVWCVVDVARETKPSYEIQLPTNRTGNGNCKLFFLQLEE